ncbi:MAG: MFS transporter [Planctomycetota bacterium]
MTDPTTPDPTTSSSAYEVTTTSTASSNETQAAESMIDPSSEQAAGSLCQRSFVGFLTTQFFGAFNDNLFKQLLLLLAIPTVAAGQPQGPDLQGVATVVFGLPFVIFGGLAGFCADRTSKRFIIVAAKWGETLIMLLGLAAFLMTPMIGFVGLWVVLFLMGLQSTFFGPGKYGILPEMLPRSQLSRANGLVLMTTFIAIIIGTAVAGPLKDAIVPAGMPAMQAAPGLWIASLVCVGIALVGVVTAHLIAPVRVAAPDLKFRTEMLGIPKTMRDLLRADRPLLMALLASCAFWLIAGLTIQAVNSLGKVQLGLSDTKTSLMVSLISVGIAAGGGVAGWLSRRLSDGRIIRAGMFGVVGFCALLSVTLPGGRHLLGFVGGIPVLMLLGASAAFFAIPIQVFLQARPPEALKGRMIAVMNQANFFAIVMSGLAYIIIDLAITNLGWPRSTVFAVMAVAFLPVAIFYRLDET